MTADEAILVSLTLIDLTLPSNLLLWMPLSFARNF
jgi:hypothetical protein